MGMIAASCRIELNEISVRAPKAESESRLARACEPVYAGKVNWSRAIPGVLERLKRILMIDITEPAPAAQQAQADQSLCARELAEKYSSSGGSWPEHPTYPRSEWKKEVEQDSVLCGYWDWVVSQLEQAAGDAKALSASFATVIRDDVNADRLAFSPALRKLAARYGAEFKNGDDPEARAIIYWDARTRTLGARIHLANWGVNSSFKADFEAAAAELARFSRARFRCFFFDESLSLTGTSTAEPPSPR